MLAGILVPITLFLVTGIVWVTFIYFRSKEKQMMIEKGMSYEQMLEFMKRNRNPFTILKIGIIFLFFGFGVGLGVMLEEANYNEGWVPLMIFTCTGLGFITAFFATKKYEVDKKQ